MKHIRTVYYTTLGGVSAGLSYFLQDIGGFDAWLKIFLIVIAADYISGLMCALIWKKSPKTEHGAFESKISIKGLVRKGWMLFFVYLAYQLDLAAGTAFMRNAVMCFFIGNDGLSIIENMGIMGLPMPKVVMNAFEALRKKGDEKTTEAQ